MTIAAPSAPAETRSRRLVPLARAVFALALGLTITFAADHSAGLGLVLFGVHALVSSPAHGLEAHLRRRQGLPWAPAAIRALVGVLAGVTALAVPESEMLLLALLSGWALVTGAAELADGALDRRSGRPGRDAILVGAVTLLLGIAVLVIPPDLVQPWQVAGSDGTIEAAGEITASIVAVGLLGAWGIIAGVLLAIGAVGDPRPTAATARDETEEVTP